MRVSVITIARTLGAGGEDLGQELADRLGFRYVDSEIIDRAAALAQVKPEEVARAEARKGLLDRIFENLARASAVNVTAGVADLSAVTVDTPGYEQLIVDVIRETADMGAVVIVAHGAGIPLAGRPDTLRLLVTASAETRARRVAAGGVDPRQAQKDVAESDRARADFLRRFYGVQQELPTHYDIVINTDALDTEHATATVMGIINA